MDFLSLTWWRKVYAKGGRVFAIGCAFVFVAPLVFQAINMRHSPGQQDVQQSGNICTVNGEAVSASELTWISQDQMGGSPGRMHAEAYGTAIFSVVERKLLLQMAKKEKVHAADADIDRAVAKERESLVGAKATDVEWETYLNDVRHKTAAEFRDHVAEGAEIQALVDHYKSVEAVTADEAKNQTSEVQLSTVFISTGPSPTAPKAKPLSDDEASKKATDLHAKAVAGADVAAMARATSPEPMSKTPNTGISEWKPEFQKSGQETPFGAFFYGTDFDKAVQKTAKGQITDVVKASGFQQGYLFAKVVDRRINLPKDFDEKKAIAALKEQRAFKKLDAAIKATIKAAKVVFPSDQIDKKAYYDYARLTQLQQESRGPMGLPAADAPSPADIKVQEDLVDSDFEAALKQHPEDTTASLMVASTLQTKILTAKPEEVGTIRDRLISLYLSAFKSYEDIDTRFTLADLYHDKHDDKSTFDQYSKILKLLNDDPPYDLSTRQKQMDFRKRLSRGLKLLAAADAPQAASVAAEQDAKVGELQVKILEDQAKQKAEEQKQADLQKAEQALANSKKTPPVDLGTKPAPTKGDPGKASPVTPPSKP